MADDDETSFKEESAPPPKRARRAVTKRKPITVAPDSDDDDDDDYEPVEPLTKLEDESGNSDNDNDNDNEDDSFAAPSTSADDQPGPSGLGKDGVEAPSLKRKNNIVLKCLECSKTFSNHKTLRRHHISHITGKWHSCYVCNKLFATAEELALHKPSHPKQVFSCDLCGKALKSKTAYKVHRRRHLQLYVDKCEECKIGFFTKQEYRLHMGSKHGNSLFICEICGKSLYDKASLLRHIETHSENYKQNTSYRCKICNKCYLQDRYLKEHYRRTHDFSNLNFVCDICGRTLKTKQSLRNHKLMHEGDKKNQCVECGKSFVRKDNLQQHMRVHTGQKPYECPICGKSFTQRTPLNVHMKRHTGKTPYRCSKCDSKFQTKTDLNMHMEKNHFDQIEIIINPPANQIGNLDKE